VERRTLFAIESQKRRRTWLLSGLLPAMVLVAA